MKLSDQNLPNKVSGLEVRVEILTARLAQMKRERDDWKQLAQSFAYHNKQDEAA